MFFGPKKAIFEITSRCNLKCRMCDIWKEKSKDFHINKFESVISELDGLKHIALTGGEPFLMPNLYDYIEVIRKKYPKIWINISTNGTQTGKIVDLLDKCKDNKISLTISYDGINSNDKIRGNSKTSILRTARILKKKKQKFSLKFTIQSANHAEIYSTAKSIEHFGVPFYVKLEENLNCHQTRSIKPEPNMLKHMDSIIKQLKTVQELSIQTNRQYMNLLIFKKNKVTCNWSNKSIFITLDGKIFICRKMNPIGSIEVPFSKLWSGRKKIVQRMKRCNDKNCYSFGVK